LDSNGSALSSSQQFDNLVTGFPINFTMVYCASCASLLALRRSAEWWREGRGPDLWFLVSCFCALVATCSSANGLFFWLILASFGVWLGMPRRFVGAIVVDMILAGMFYLRGMRPAPHGSPVATLLQLPIRAAVFIGSPFDILRADLATILGAPSDNGRVVFAGTFGALGIVVFALGGILLWRGRHHYTNGQAALLHLEGFVVLTAALVGFGRADFPLVAALDTRYVTHGMLFWLALAGFYWQFRRSDPDGLDERTAPVAFNAAILPIIFAVALRQPYWIHHVKEYTATLGQIQAAIVANVYDEPVWRISYPPSGLMILEEVDYLRQNHLSVFTEPWANWTGRRTEGLFVIDPAKSCIGAFDSVTPITSVPRPGWQVTGWAWDLPRQAGPGIVVLIDSTRHIAGVVNNPVDREDVPRVIREVRSTRVGWLGYVSGSVPMTLTAYLLEGDGRSLCEIGSR
jgi:hypothetical protein